MTYLTSDRDALAVALYDAEGFHAADSWETETDIVRGRYEGLAENLITSGAVTPVSTLAEPLCEAICDLLGEPRVLVPGEVSALLATAAALTVRSQE